MALSQVSVHFIGLAQVDPALKLCIVRVPLRSQSEMVITVRELRVYEQWHELSEGYTSQFRLLCKL